jgi:hypothetical protein
VPRFPTLSLKSDPIAIGMGLGITQGSVLGLGVSVFLLVFVAWKGQRDKLLEEVHGVYVALERIRAELAKR